MLKDDRGKKNSVIFGKKLSATKNVESVLYDILNTISIELYSLYHLFEAYYYVKVYSCTIGTYSPIETNEASFMLNAIVQKMLKNKR